MAFHDEKGETYYTAKEAMQYLGVSSSRFYNMVSEGKFIRYTRGISAYPVYKRSELKKQLEISAPPELA